MSYDANRINELLAQLQNSTAFQTAVTSSTVPQVPASNSVPAPDIPSSQEPSSTQPASSPQPPASGSTVFDLLARLNPGSSANNQPLPPRSQAGPAEDHSERPQAVKSDTNSSSGLDLRYMTVQQALPHISRLAQRVEFREKVKKMQEAQNQLEQSLYANQREVMNKHEQRVAYAKNRANIIGVAITEKENEELALQLSEDLKKFNTSQVLVAWDSQRTKQQSQLEALGVPCMFVTTEPAALQRQQKVLRILLESINESEDIS